MLQAFIVVLREGFEAFLIVAIILAYLAKTLNKALIPAVYWGIAISVIASAVLGYFLYQGANTPLWEGVLGLVSAFLVGWLVIHMWRTAPKFKSQVEGQLSQAVAGKASASAFWGVLLFTVLMISREGMETALLLLQIHESRIVTGVMLGIAAAAFMACLWARVSYLIDLQRFFQVTSIFLLLFIGQILIYSFHEFTEAGIFPYSDALHVATEPFSPEGLYGKWFSVIMIAICAIWLSGVWLVDKISNPFAKSGAACSSTN